MLAQCYLFSLNIVNANKEWILVMIDALNPMM